MYLIGMRHSPWFNALQSQSEFLQNKFKEEMIFKGNKNINFTLIGRFL